MESLLTVSRDVTVVASALLSLLGVIICVYIVIICAKFYDLLKQITTTAESIQQMSMLPLQAVTLVLQKLFGTGE